MVSGVLFKKHINSLNEQVHVNVSVVMVIGVYLKTIILLLP